MLDHLFGSKTRVRILRLFLSNPNQAYFVRELTRRIDAQINAVRNELENLVEMGLLEVVPHDEIPEEHHDVPMMGSKKYYRINIGAPVYPELRALFQKSRVGTEKEFVNRLSQVGQINYLALTGFFVGEEGSTTDLLIVGKVTKEKVVPIIRNFEQEIGREINFTLMSAQEFKYRRDVTDRFLYGILESKKIILVDTVSERVSSGATATHFV